MTLHPGAAIRVKDDWPETRGPCHIRTPHYLRGQRGTVMRHLGRFPNPEDLAFARPAASIDLYHVAFHAQAIWPDADPGTHNPGAHDLVVEIFEHWLEPMGEPA
ncbi:MAG: SH3-like domain-containing protein [Janthinobacterium lividum]